MLKLPPPDFAWLSRLRRGHYLWLVKEQVFAKVEFAWEPPEPGHKTGRIGIRVDRFIDSWFVDVHGRGIDGSRLFQPVEGSLPDTDEPISEPVVRHIHRELERINRRLDRLDGVLAHLPQRRDWE
jgi:hypothetical protein